MCPQVVTHLGAEYRLDHLAPLTGEFAWRGEDQREFQFVVRVEFSSHCYSIKQQPPLPDGCGLVPDGVGRPTMRVLCPIRHGHSLELPAIIRGLFVKPGTQIDFTHDDNWSIFRLRMPLPMGAAQRYCVFFRMRPQSQHDPDRLPFLLRLNVESAYPRDGVVKVRHRLSFGRLAERIALAR